MWKGGKWKGGSLIWATVLVIILLSLSLFLYHSVRCATKLANIDISRIMTVKKETMRIALALLVLLPFLLHFVSARGVAFIGGGPSPPDGQYPTERTYGDDEEKWYWIKRYLFNDTSSNTFYWMLRNSLLIPVES